MKLINKIILGVLLLGVVLIVISLIFTKGNIVSSITDLQPARTYQEVTETQEINSYVFDLSIDDIEFYTSTDGKLLIQYYDEEKPKYTYKYENETVYFTYVRDAKNFNFFNFKKYVVKVYLPTNTITSLDCSVTTGDIKSYLNSLIVDKIELNVTTGKIQVDNIRANEVKIVATTGDCELENISGKTLKCTSSTGDVNMNGLTFNSIYIGLTTGRVEVGKVVCDDLTIHTSTGSINGDQLVAKDAKFNSSNGSINVKFSDSSTNYSLVADTNTGNIRVSGTDINISTANHLAWGVGEKSIQAKASTGSISIKFN